MTTTQRGILPWVFENVRVNVRAIDGASIDTAIANNVMATVEYRYAPADDDGPAEAVAYAIKLIEPLHMRGDASTVALDAGFNIAHVLPEIEVEKLEEIIMARKEKERP